MNQQRDDQAPSPGHFVPVELVGRHVHLVPLAQEHCAGLVDAVRDGELWRLWYTSAPKPEAMAEEIGRRLGLQAAGSMLPFTVMALSSGRPVGMTTYMNIDEANRRLEIGSTWLGASAQGTKVNPEAKLLQLTRAFDELDCIAVEFRTHWHNRQSRRAIAALGAKQDGVLRNHVIWRDGTLRDTVVFSIVREEWPAVRSGLRARLGAS